MQVERTGKFNRWLADLRDREAVRRILLRLERIAITGNIGDCRSVGGGVSEIKLDIGPGYRVYFTRREGRVILLLLGGDKSTQAQDILEAQRIVASLG